MARKYSFCRPQFGNLELDASIYSLCLSSDKPRRKVKGILDESISAGREVVDDLKPVLTVWNELLDENIEFTALL